jgi:hypothetical protein
MSRPPDGKALDESLKLLWSDTGVIAIQFDGFE